MLLITLLACTPAETDDTGEVQPTTDVLRARYVGCSLTLISDGWNTGSDDYIDTFEFDDRGNWTENTWFGPYHGETEVDWFEHQTFDDAGYLTGRSYEYDGDEGTYEVVQHENGFPETITEYENGTLVSVTTYQYEKSLDGYLDAIQDQPVMRHYGYQMPATRKTVDEAPIDGKVDSWTKYSFDDSWQLIGYEANEKGGNNANIFAEYVWADGVIQSSSREDTQNGTEQTGTYSWDADGRKEWISSTNTDTTKWQEYTEYYTWDCP